MTHEPTIDRRTVLKTTGAALSGTALVTSQASANKCREIAYDAPVYDMPDNQGCVGEPTATIPAGTIGRVDESCSYYRWFQYPHNSDYWGWVPEDYLKEC